MLRYSVKLDNRPTDLVELAYESLYLSPDLGFISGVTSAEYGLIDGQDILLYANDYDGYISYPIEVKKITRRGYVKYNQTFPIISENNERMITYLDGQTYIISSNNDIYINQNRYQVSSDATYITIPTKYYVENGVVTIYDVKYIVDFDSPQPSITLRDGQVLLVQNYNKLITTTDGITTLPNLTEVIHFTIRKSLDYQLNVDQISCASNFRYIFYNDIPLYLTQINDSYYLSGQTFNNGEPIECDYQPMLYGINVVNFNGVLYDLHDEWRNVKNAPQMHFYCDFTHLNFEDGQVILAKPTSPQNVSLAVINDTVKYHGTVYPLDSSVVTFVKLEDEQEVELHILNDDSGYFILNDITYAVTIENGRCNTISEFSDYSRTYDLQTYQCVFIDGVRHLVTNDENGRRVVQLLDNKVIRLIIQKVTQKNQLLCYVDCANDIWGRSDYLDNSMTIPDLLKRGGYTYELYNPLFDDSMISPKSESERKYNNITYKLYNAQKYLTIPLTPSSNVGLNLQQEDLVQTQFVNKEKKRLVNNVIDMERDVYYPVYKNGDNYNLIDKLVFDLHFLTRDLSTWKIREDLSYNLFDYYDWGSDNNGQVAVDENVYKEEHGYYPPSDLAYFLRFTNNDVFYQKLKIEKSFLRISFYNSTDPHTQTLLHTSSIFINEGEWYQKYIDHIDCDTQYIDVEWHDTKTKSNSINVGYDTYNGEKITMDEDKRLSCRFTVKNRYTSTESSEGFYLYIFREYSDGLRPQDIYMKVEFNHAGEGRTINFMLPFKEENGTKTMLHVKEDKNLIKEGVSLNELYEHLYIPLHAVYNESLKKYVYYLPEWLTQNTDKETVMKLSLFEVKIKDES